MRRTCASLPLSRWVGAGEGRFGPLGRGLEDVGESVLEGIAPMAPLSRLLPPTAIASARFFSVAAPRTGPMVVVHDHPRRFYHNGHVVVFV